MSRLAFVAMLLVATSAHADRATKTLGEGLELQVDDGSLYVARGKLRARLGGAVSLVKVTIANRQVDALVEDLDCSSPDTYHWTLDQLAARLDNVAAYGQHVHKAYKDAAAGFARAAKLDPTWPIAAYNLASADQLGGDLDGAVAALAPWLASAPVQTYAQVASDPELAPLLARPELRALRAKSPGTAKVTTDVIVGDVAYAPERGLVAVARVEASWGACLFEREVDVFEAATGKRIAVVPIVKYDETTPECRSPEGGGQIAAKAKAAVAARAVAVQQALDDFGFSPAKLERGTEPTGAFEAKRISSLVHAKLGVVGKDGSVRVLRKDTELGHATTLTRLDLAIYVEDARVMVIFSGRPGREGCEGTDPTQIDVIPIK